MNKLRVLDLFSGIGGFSLGLERTGGFETAAFCEYEDFPRRVLKKHWPQVPCFSDVRNLKGQDIDGPVDVICGGYPCQPYSTAGKRGGAEDDRHLWPEFMRLVDELRPTWVIGENVAGHISMGLDDVLSDLENAGYACRSFIVPACAVGASHRRDRVWTLAHCNSERGAALRGECAPAAREGAFRRNFRARSNSDVEWEIANGGAGENSCNVADAIGNDAQGQQPCGAYSQERTGPQQRPTGSCGDGGRRRRTQPPMGRMANGFSCWLDEPDERVKAGVKDRAARLKALGNAVHPDIPMMLGRAILQAEQAA